MVGAWVRGCVDVGAWMCVRAHVGGMVSGWMNGMLCMAVSVTLIDPSTRNERDVDLVTGGKGLT